MLRVKPCCYRSANAPSPTANATCNAVVRGELRNRICFVADVRRETQRADHPGGKPPRNSYFDPTQRILASAAETRPATRYRAPRNNTARNHRAPSWVGLARVTGETNARGEDIVSALCRASARAARVLLGEGVSRCASLCDSTRSLVSDDRYRRDTTTARTTRTVSRASERRRRIVYAPALEGAETIQPACDGRNEHLIKRS